MWHREVTVTPERVARCSVFLPPSPRQHLAVRESQHFPALKSSRAGIWQLGLSWVQRESWRAGSTGQLFSMQGNARDQLSRSWEGIIPNEKGPRLKGHLALAVPLLKVIVTPGPAPSSCTQVHVAPLFSVRFLYSPSGFTINLQSRTNTPNPPAHLCSYFFLN